MNPTKLELLYLSTPDCNVCKVLRPKVEAMISEHPPWTFTYVNLNESPAYRGKWMVFTVPTILLLADGKEMNRFSRYIHLDELTLAVERIQSLSDAETGP